MGADHISSLFVLLSSTPHGAFWGLEAGEVVGLDPAWRSDGKAGFGPGSKFARGLDVAADESRLRGGEIRTGEVVLEAVGHRQMAVGVGRVRLAQHCRLQDRDRLLDVRAVTRSDQRLPQHDLDQRRAGRELYCGPPRAGPCR